MGAGIVEQLKEIDEEIYRCNLCSDMVEKFPNGKTVSIGKYSDIVILGEAPANNGWRKSGIAWYDVNHKLLPSGIVLQKLLDEINKIMPKEIICNDAFLVSSVDTEDIKNRLKICC